MKRFATRSGLAFALVLTLAGVVLAEQDGVSKTAQISAGQHVTILNTDHYLQQYLDAARNRPATEYAALYAKYVYGPVLKACGEGGEYYEYGKYNLTRPIANLGALARELAALRRAHFFGRIEAALRKSARLLPGPDTTVYVLAADPDAAYIRTDLHGTAGYTFGAGKILLQVAPTADWQEWLPYTVTHEYHHSAWTWKHYADQPSWPLLHGILFEGKADVFAHTVFPKQTATWANTLAPVQEASVWQKMKPELASTDFRANDKFLFGREGVPKLAGYTIGFHIVESYIKNHPAATIEEWSALNEQQLLDQSGYVAGTTGR
ncbi:MAG TPA: DUF2268 domain-containing putative Zn-dependent protease [Candidatus Angelobacter sp.]|nr:DUF2268 domain-containing putative Zn-dependent protease [Candidatus Angelobacter sp.]